MPIRINLKEIFSSDPQEINVEKVNFNFNKLLELGVGTPGPIGTTGPQGPAGPIGLTGQQGPRGATWWVDNGDPNNITFPVGSLIDGDLYLDGTGFETWQYDLPTNTWTKVASISTAVTSYLNQSGGSPFRKDFGSSPQSTDSSRFITFGIRKVVTPPETFRAQSNAKNDILFLSNFDESVIPGFPANPNQYFTALNSIYVDHDTSTYDQSRYHIELGSKYAPSGGGVSTLSKSKNNLKIQYYREEINGSFPNLIQTQADSKFLNIGRFSLSIAPDDSVTTIGTGVDSNGAFQFKVPKFNTDTPLGSIDTPREELSVYFAPWESMQILDPDYSHVVADGITLSYFANTQLNSTLGIAYNYVNSSVARLHDRALFMIDTSTDLHGILLDDYTYINGNLNVLAKVSIGNVNPTSHLTVAGNASIGDGYTAIQAPTNGAIIEGKVGMGISAPTAKLHINNGTTENSFLVEDDTNLDSTPFVINNAGEVGIGVTSPTAKVHINNSTALNSFLVEDSTATDSTPFVIDADGNVGVRIGIPFAPLHVQSLFPTTSDVPDGLSLILQRYNTTSQSINFFQNGFGNQIISYSAPDNVKSLVFHSTSNANDDPSTGTSSNDIIFKIRGVETLRMKDNISLSRKDIGIGTTTPTSKLHIIGTEKVLHVEGTTDVIKIDTNNSGAGKALVCLDNQGSADWQPITGFGVPVGAVVSYFGIIAPVGWLVCNGAAIPAGSAYDALRTHMAQFGTTTVPDLQERFIVGVGDNGTAGGPYSLAQAAGEAAVTLTPAQLAPHSHSATFTGTAESHRHGINISIGFEDSGGGRQYHHLNEADQLNPGNAINETSLTPKGTISIDDNTPSGQAHNNLPPYYALTYIIKY